MMLTPEQAIAAALLVPLLGALLISLAGRAPNLREGITLASASTLLACVVSLWTAVSEGARPSLNMETRLKKWRIGIEAVISNLKRGFGLRVCNWKGFKHFKAKVIWSVLAYNQGIY